MLYTRPTTRQRLSLDRRINGKETECGGLYRRLTRRFMDRRIKHYRRRDRRGTKQPELDA